MSIAFNIEIIEDTASPAVKEVLARCSPQRVATAVRDPVVSLMKRNYERQPHNKMGGTPTNFWQNASRATHGDIEGGDVVIETSQIGVRQRLYGGVIRPVNKQFLAIPARAEAYGKSPREFPDLIIINLGRQQGAPRLALVQADRSKVSFGRQKKDGSRTVKHEGESGGGVMYWLVKEVRQDANPDVIPSNAEFAATIQTALENLVPKK